MKLSNHIQRGKGLKNRSNRYMKTIGIDIGTTTISSVVLDNTIGKVLESGTIQNDSFIAAEHEWERIQDVPAIIDKAKNVLDELLDRHPDVLAIGLTGQMHGILYVDADGKCCSPLYTWQDQRGSLVEFEGMSLVNWIRQKCGVTVYTGYGLTTHIYQSKKSLIPKEAISFCTIPDYLGMVLTEKKRPVLHISMAASLGFFDVGKKVFQKDKLKELGMDAAMLPDVSDDFSVIGYYKNRPVTVALGDNQAGFLGSVGLKENAVLLNVGTGSQISVLSNQYFETDGIEARPFTKDTFILAGSSLCGGRAYAILEKFFRDYVITAGIGDIPQYDIMAKLAEKGTASQDNMKVVTMFHGTRTNPNLRGSISNLSEDNFTPEGLILGVLNGMAQELYDMFGKIHTGIGIEAKTLIASGNGVRKNAVLQRVLKDVFGAELFLAEYEEEAACGAAISSLQNIKSM